MKQTHFIFIFMITVLIAPNLYANYQHDQTNITASSGSIQNNSIYTNFSIIGEPIAIQSISTNPYTNSAGFLFTASEPYNFTISGTLSFTGNETGFLFVDALSASNIPVGVSYDWLEGDTEKTFSLSVPDGNYTLVGFIDLPDSDGEFDGIPGDCEPLGQFTDLISSEKTDCHFTLIIPDECDSFLQGDVDGNGDIELHDVKLAFRFYLGQTSTDQSFDAANVCHIDDDTSISINDVRGVFRIFLGGSANCDN